MFKVITMSDSAYFDAGELFLKTRNRINADFILYGPDLSKNQIKILYNNNIKYIPINEHIYKTQMQFLKFHMITEQILTDIDKKYKGFTFVDFDTFFINDWKHIFIYNFDLGITVRNKLTEIHAYSNGGVIFAKHSALELIKLANIIILDGYSEKLPEYGKIWKTLEWDRRPSKTHYRNNLRWWVDQIFFSSLVKRYLKKYKNYAHKRIPEIFDFENFKIALFSCNYYNILNSQPCINDEPGIYIKHLKNAGRRALGINYKIQEKLL